MAESTWRKYNEQYKLCVLLQTIFVELKKDDDEWDATQTPYYIWMMENGPLIVELEDELRLRGWKRPKRTFFNPSLFAQQLNDVLKACGESPQDTRITEIITDALIKLP